MVNIMYRLWYAGWIAAYSKIAEWFAIAGFLYQSKAVATRLYSQHNEFLKPHLWLSDEVIRVLICQITEKPFSIHLTYTIKNEFYEDNLKLAEKHYGTILINMSLAQLRKDIIQKIRSAEWHT